MNRAFDELYSSPPNRRGEESDRGRLPEDAVPAMSAKLLPFPPHVLPAAASLSGPVDGMPISPQPLHQLRAMVETGEEMLLTQSEPLQRILQKLAAGLIECVLLSRLPTLHALFPDPSQTRTRGGHSRLAEDARATSRRPRRSRMTRMPTRSSARPRRPSVWPRDLPTSRRSGRGWRAPSSSQEKPGHGAPARSMGCPLNSPRPLCGGYGFSGALVSVLLFCRRCDERRQGRAVARPVHLPQVSHRSLRASAAVALLPWPCRCRLPFPPCCWRGQKKARTEKREQPGGP